MEEPENGIHPSNLAAVLSLVQDLAVDPNYPPADDNPFRQVIVNTHSPAVLQLCRPDDLLFADVQPYKSPTGAIVRSLFLRSYKDSWRATAGGRVFSEAEVLPYLAWPPGRHLRLPRSRD